MMVILLKHVFPPERVPEPQRLSLFNRLCSAQRTHAHNLLRALLQLAYLSSFEIHAPAFSSAQLALTAASVVPLKRRQK